MHIIAFEALIKRKRGEANLFQEKLTGKIYSDPARKSDISRLERGKIANPQEKTIQYLCQALEISAAEMDPLRQSRPSAAQLENIPSLSREALQNLAAHFNIENSFDLCDEALRKELTKRSDAFRALKGEVDAIPETMRNLANLKTAAQDAIDRVDLEEVEHLMAMVHETELEEAAKSAEIRANTALLRGKVEDAYRYLSAAADSFAAVDPDAPAQKRLDYSKSLYDHGLRYGSTGMIHAATMIRDAITSINRNDQSLLWARAQNNLAISLRNHGTRTQGAEGAELLAQAVTAYRSALEVRIRADHPVHWAETQQNIAVAEQARADHDTCTNPRPHLNAALEAVENALTIFDPVHMSYNHTKATELRDDIQVKLDLLPPPE